MDATTASSSTELAPFSTRRRARYLEEIRPPLRRLASSFARVQRADPDDLYQTAIEVALRRLPEYQPSRGASFYTYVYNPVRDALRAECAGQKRERAFGRAVQRQLGCEADDGSVIDCAEADVPYHGDRLAIGALEVAETLAGPSSPEEQVADAEERELLRARVVAALEMLDAMDREIVVRKDVEGQTIADAARALGVTYHQARWRYLGARERLERLLSRSSG